MITVTGWTWEYIGEHITIPRFLTLSKYWQDHPPVHHLVAAFVGYKAGDGALAASAPSQNRGQEMETFFADLQGIGGQVSLS